MPTKKRNKRILFCKFKKKKKIGQKRIRCITQKKYKQVREKDYKNCIPKNDNSLDFMVICGRSGSRATWYYCIILGWKKRGKTRKIVRKYYAQNM
jgi:hypothetical protein